MKADSGSANLLPGEITFDHEYTDGIAASCDDIRAVRIVPNRLATNVCRYGMQFHKNGWNLRTHSLGGVARSSHKIRVFG